MMKQVAKAQPPSDDLAQAISGAMRGMHDLREENATLRARNDELEHSRSVLDSEIAGLKAQLDNERTERRHYQSLATEIITRLDVVGRTVDDVVQRAQHEAQRQRKDHPRGEVAEFKIPSFLKQAIGADLAAEPKPEAAAPVHSRPVAAGGFPKAVAPERVPS